MKKKYIVIGLGNFGESLSKRLTESGHEVIGVDNSHSRVEKHKDEITSTIQLDACDVNALKMLPLNDADAVIVAIGEDFGASVMATALLKQLKVRNLISRAINPLHYAVIDAIGVHQILRPEKDSAERFANNLEFKGAISSFRVDDEHIILEMPVAPIYFGHNLKEANLKDRFDLQLIAVKRRVKAVPVFGKQSDEYEVLEDVHFDLVLTENDVFVLYGRLSSFKKMCEVDV
jgi:trk system potassium uptake protein TrkA